MPTLFDTIRLKVARQILKGTSGGPTPYELNSFFQSGQPIYTDMTVRKATREGYRMSIAVYRAVRSIVQAASGIPWVALDEEGGEEKVDHPVTQLLKKPNPEFSGQDMIEFTASHLKLAGNSLWCPVMMGGTPRELWMVMPDMVKPIPSDAPGEWLKGWELKTSQGATSILPPESFIHHMQFDPANPYWGVGDLMAAARTVDTDNEAQDSQKVIMQNRNVPPGGFQFENPLSADQIEEAQRVVREKFLQKSKRGEPWVLGGGYKWFPMSLTPMEMDYIKSRLQNKRDIAAAFGVDSWWVGDKENSTYNNVMEARKALYEDAVVPLLEDIRSTLNLRLAPLYQDKPYITFDLSNVAALRGDFGKKTEQAKTLWAMGVPFEQINDKLELGFGEFEGWENGYLPFNVAAVGAPTAQPTDQAKSTKALNLTTEEQKTIHWKKVDGRREAWWPVIQKKLIPLYEQEGTAVAAAYPAIAGAIKTSSKRFEKLLLATDSVLLEDFGRVTADDLGADSKSMEASERKWIYDPFTAAAKAWLAKHVAESVVSIAGTNLEDAKRIIRQGAEAGQSNAEIARSLKVYYDENAAFKAMRVARTETTAAAGFGQHDAAEQSGFVKTHSWISSRDSRVRSSHAHIDGETKKLNERYSNGAMYPGDPAAGAAEVIQCRCAESFGTVEA